MKALVYVDSHPKLRFFFRLERALLGVVDFVYVTNYLSVCLRARSRGRPCRIIAQSGNRGSVTFQNECVQAIAGTLSPDRCAELAWSSVIAFHEAVDRFGAELAIIWNGSRICERALSEVAHARGLKRVFLEIGNFPGKLFADSQGVNAQSSLHHDPGQLDALPEPCTKYFRWKKEFFHAKRSGRCDVPQRARALQLNPLRLVDEVGWLRVPRDGLEGVAARAVRAVGATRNGEVGGVPSVAYLFFPLQVALDSQIVINYGKSLLEAVHDAKRISDEQDLCLVIKPHPSEPKVERAISELVSSDPRVFLCYGNTTRLIEQASEVVVINSTVGLEAILMGRPVQLLGRAFYEGFQEAHADKYVDSFLLDIEFFGSGEIPRLEAQRLIERAC